MTVRPRTMVGVSAAALAVTLAGCSGATSGDSDAALHDTGSASPTSPTSATTATTATTPATTPTSTLPPGDPGVDAPGTGDPNGELGNQTGRPGKNNARTSVPPTAVLDVGTMSEVAGGKWAASSAPTDSCTVPRPTKAVATRSTQLTGVIPATGSRLVETVSTHRGAAAAIAAVHAIEGRLVGCHATSASDPRIGDASVQANLTAPDGTITIVTAAAVDGVTFVLSGWGPTSAPRPWSALTDIALGSTCVAAIEGCH